MSSNYIYANLRYRGTEIDHRKDQSNLGPNRKVKVNSRLIGGEKTIHSYPTNRCHSRSMFWGNSFNNYKRSKILVYVGFAYGTVALRNVIPMPAYLMLPLGIMFGCIASRQIMGMAGSFYENSLGAFEQWGRFARTQIGKSNSKYCIKLVEATAPMKMHARFGDNTLYFMKRSTIVASFSTIHNYTIDALLSIPSSVFSKL